MSLSLLRAGIFVVVAAYVGVCASLYLLQRQFLYFPTSETEAEGAEHFFLGDDGVSIKIWKVARENTKAVIYFGGNAEPVSYSIPALSAALPEYDVYLVNYRGYGGSEGKPSESANFADALAIYDRVAPGYDEVALIGRSLGSGVATYLASERQTERILLITPYDSVKNIAQAKFPLIPVSLLLKDKYDSAARAPDVTAPVMLIIAENDGVITRPHSDALAKSFSNAAVETVVIPATDHLSVSEGAAFWLSMERFFDSEA
jgi:pimeloyl-ACP methyl ester carboxylesterase